MTDEASGSAAGGEPGAGVFDWLDERARDRAAAGQARRLHPRPADAQVLDLAGDDYLGLCRDKRVTSAAAAAALKWGAGATGPRLVTGTTELHADLERELAEFAGAGAALVFSSGFAANLGAVTALGGADTAVVADRHAHASLADGCRQAHSPVAIAGHRDVAEVRRALATRKVPRALVVTESVLGADGDIAPLPELHAACREHSAALLADDAHGFGVLGEGGRGGVYEAGLAGAADVVTTVSLATALGAQGGAVLGPRRVIAHLVNAARAFVHDTGLAPAAAGAALTALRLLRAEPERPGAVLAAAAALSEGLRAAGLDAGAPSSAVVTVPAPSAEAATRWTGDLAQRGVAAGSLRPPSAPDGAPRLRLTARADLTGDDIDRAVREVSETAPRG